MYIASHGGLTLSHHWSDDLTLSSIMTILVHETIIISTMLDKCQDCVLRSKRTQGIDPMLGQCWATIYDGGPTLG